MSGNRYLLDTNAIIALLQSNNKLALIFLIRIFGRRILELGDQDYEMCNLQAWRN